MNYRRWGHSALLASLTKVISVLHALMQVHNCFPFKGWSWTEPLLFVYKNKAVTLSLFRPCSLFLYAVLFAVHSQCILSNIHSLTDKSDPLHHLWTESHACVANKRQNKTTLNVSVCLLSMILCWCKVASGGQGVAFYLGHILPLLVDAKAKSFFLCRWTLICNI